MEPERKDGERPSAEALDDLRYDFWSWFADNGLPDAYLTDEGLLALRSIVIATFPNCCQAAGSTPKAL